VLALVGACVLALFGAAVLVRGSGSHPDGVDQRRAGPVLLVPGYGGSTASLQVLADALRNEGRDVVLVELPGDGRGDLRDQARQVQAAADAAVARGAPSVDLVGYSAGGVVVRLWAAQGGVAVARRIVTLGSPHHGTQVAATGATLAPEACPTACRQLVPGSDLLESLEETPDGPVWTSVWTAQDETVTPPETARLSGAVNIQVQGVCPDARVSHGLLPRDPLVLGLVTRALGPAAMVAAPSSAQCDAIRALGAAGRA
jgi:triacylglycerol esterase/lipase EstA (alpha/beta hydrolase family)